MRLGLSLVVMIVFNIFCMNSSRAFSAELLRDKSTSIRIILGNHAEKAEEEGAQELQAYIAKATGSSLPVIRESEDRNGPAIVIGTPATCQWIKEKETLLTRDWEGLGFEGFIIKRIDKVVYITARTSLGVRHGCYDFLETFLGIRWLKPVDGDYIPKSGPFVLPKVNKQSVPAIKVRSVNVLYQPRVPETDRWLKHQRLACLKSSGGHFYSSAVPPDLFASHPEYFPLVNGKRVKDGQVCTSNPEVQKLLADWAVKQADKGAQVLVLFANDTGGWCECDACQALDPPEEKRLGCMTTRYLKSLEVLARTMARKHPQVVLMAGAYASYLHPPMGNYHPPSPLGLNYVTYGHCWFHGYDDPSCPCMRETRKTLQQWQKTGVKVGLYGYLSEGEGIFLPSGFQMLPFAPAIATEIRFLKKLGGLSWLPEVMAEDMTDQFKDQKISDEWWGNKLTYYVAAKMLWNPDLDEKTIGKEFYECFFGAAGKPLWQAYCLMAKAWSASEGHSMYFFPSHWAAAKYMTPQLQQQLSILHQQVLKLVPEGDPKLQERVKREIYFVERWKQLTKQIPPQSGSAPRNSFQGSPKDLLNSNLWDKVELLPLGYLRKTWAPGYADFQRPGSVQMMWDADHVYMKINTTYDPKSRMLTPDAPLTYVMDQNKVTGDCYLEMYLNPSGKRDSYYNLAYGSDHLLHTSYSPCGFVFQPLANPLCEVFESFNSEKQQWQVFLAFPAKSFGTRRFAAAQQWAVNVKFFNQGMVCGWPDSSLHDTNSSGLVTLIK